HIDGEGSYHSLYLLCSAPMKWRSGLHISPGTESYLCLSRGGGLQEKLPVTWAAFHQSFTDLGIAENEKLEVFRLLALVLHIGNIEFTEDSVVGSEGSQVVRDENYKHSKELLQLVTCAIRTRNLRPPNPSHAVPHCFPPFPTAQYANSSASPKRISNCLDMPSPTVFHPHDPQLQDDSLAEALTRRTAGGGVIGSFDKELTVKQADAARDSLCMSLYQLAFDWCVSLLNDKTAAPKEAMNGTIRILDLCINFANESLQSLFISHLYAMEAEEHAAEGIEVKAPPNIKVSDEVIKLISGRPGVFEVLDESSALDRSDAQTLQEFHSKFSRNKAYRQPLRGSGECFAIHHFAGQAAYPPTPASPPFPSTPVPLCLASNFTHSDHFPSLSHSTPTSSLNPTPLQTPSLCPLINSSAPHPTHSSHPPDFFAHSNSAELLPPRPNHQLFPLPTVMYHVSEFISFNKDEVSPNTVALITEKTGFSRLGSLARLQLQKQDSSPRQLIMYCNVAERLE
ncbi:MAG: hypothetical protein SGPRY_009823, partial [Prymnesium sp.]